MPLGIGFVRFVTAESAISAFAELDKTYYQGRKLHIKPAERKPPQEVQEPLFPPNPDGTPQERLDPNWEKAKKEGAAAASTNYKKEKEQILKTNFDDETNWNYLFMNQDTVATSMAKQLNQTKGEFFDKEAAGSMAVKMAKSETIIINQTKQWLKENDVIDFDVLDKTSRVDCKRNHYTLLVKNLPYTAKEAELKKLFERHGELKRFMVSPFNTLAIAEFTSKSFAKAALKQLAYHKVNYVNPIYLEYAPKGFVRKTVEKQVDEEDAEKAADADDDDNMTKEEVADKQTR